MGLFKVFPRNGTSEMMYHFELEGAPDSNRENHSKTLGYCGAYVEIRLSDNLPKNLWHKLFFDNYFNYIKHPIKLREQGIWATAILMKDRVAGCILKEKKS